MFIYIKLNRDNFFNHAITFAENCSGTSIRLRTWRTFLFHQAACRAVDPHYFFADPDPAVLLNVDPDPDLAAFIMWIRIQLNKICNQLRTL